MNRNEEKKTLLKTPMALLQKLKEIVQERQVNVCAKSEKDQLTKLNEKDSVGNYYYVSCV